jgi:hypothetical protein
MEDKEAINILIRMLDKYSFSGEEKKAVSTAIGILGWTKLAQSRIKNKGKALKTKRAKDIKW